MTLTKDNPIYIIEDDYLQSKNLESAFEGRYQGRKVKVFDSEAAFRLSMENAADEQVPGLVICDAMLPWSLPGDPEPAQRPSEVDQPTGYIKGGNRCYQFARSRATTPWKRVPWLFHTVLTQEEMDFKNTVGNDNLTGYIAKDAALDALLAMVDRMLFDLTPASEEETRFFEQNPIMCRILKDGLKLKSVEGFPTLSDLLASPI